MPQMAPISWLSLFIIFSIALMLFSIMNYYTNIYSPKSKIIKKSFNKSMNWKW